MSFVMSWPRSCPAKTSSILPRPIRPGETSSLHRQPTVRRGAPCTEKNFTITCLPAFQRRRASWFRLFQQAHFKSKDKWGRKAPPFRTFLKAINETITDYPADLVYKADRGDFHWRIASSKRRGSKSVNKTPHNPTKQTVN
jgi:hypothetical protein